MNRDCLKNSRESESGYTVRSESSKHPLLLLLTSVMEGMTLEIRSSFYDCGGRSCIFFSADEKRHETAEKK